MYTVIFRRQRHSSDYTGSSDGRTQFFTAKTKPEAEAIIKSCVFKQITIEQDYKTRYASTSHPYGDYDFVVLYNGYMVYEGYDFDEDGIEDYTDTPDDHQIEFDIDARKIMTQIKTANAQRFELLTTFMTLEKKIKRSNEEDDHRRLKEIIEREQLANLLKKYPDMGKV